MTQVVQEEEEMRRVKEETKMENNNEEDEEDNVYQEDNNENEDNYDNEDDRSGGDGDEPEEDESQDSTMMELKMEGFVKEEAFDTPEKKVGRFEYACRTCGHKAGAKRALRHHMRTVHPSLLKVFFQNKRNISSLLQENLQ